VSAAAAAAAAAAARRYPQPVRQPASRGYLYYTAAGRRYTTIDPQPGSATRLARRLLRKGAHS
jgi:hypothetical protein